MSEINTQMLKEVIPDFNKFLASEGQQWIEERKKKDEFFSKHFSEQEIDNLEEGTLRQLIHLLWAFNGWGNKDWILQEMLKSGVSTIKEAFKKLLYGKEPIAERFDFIKEKVLRMGAACISEILAHHDHSKYPIWNRRSKHGLAVLGISEDQLPKSTQITGLQYSAFCELMQKLRKEVAQNYSEISDLFDLDFLLYFISITLSEKKIDEIIIAQADDDSAWEKPVRVRRTTPSSVPLPPALAELAVFFAHLHREASVEDWLTRIIKERIDLEETAFAELKRELMVKTYG